jgi:membrane associated rhomboid family serine protease
MSSREPIFNVPGPVISLLAAFAGVHGLREWLAPADADRLIVALAFIPARYTATDYAIPGGDIAGATSFLTHAFTHADLTHLFINSAWLLAFGSILARRIGPARFFAFFASGAIAGALAYLAMNWGQPTPVVGASGAIAALMGAVMRFLFVAIDRRQGYLLRENPAAIPAMSLARALSDRRILAASAIFIAINLLALIGFGALGEAGGIAWEAHVGGYLFGLVAFGFFDVAPQHEFHSSLDAE